MIKIGKQTSVISWKVFSDNFDADTTFKVASFIIAFTFFQVGLSHLYMRLFRVWVRACVGACVRPRNLFNGLIEGERVTF